MRTENCGHLPLYIEGSANRERELYHNTSCLGLVYGSWNKPQHELSSIYLAAETQQFHSRFSIANTNGSS
jgi:hypothetical protein